MDPTTLLAFVRVHWKMIVAISYVVSNVVVALTPKRYQATRWFGDLLWLAHLTAAHAHADEPTAFKLPILNTPIRFGIETAIVPAAVASATSSADTTAPTKPPPGANGSH